MLFMLKQHPDFYGIAWNLHVGLQEVSVHTQALLNLMLLSLWYSFFQKDLQKKKKKKKKVF